jgi:diaminopimelate decarboxylase
MPGPLYDGHVLKLDGVALDAPARECGTPLYVYSRAIIERRYRALDEALAPLSHQVLFSVKANSNLAILHVLAELGAGADVVSGGELVRALRAGIPPGKIVFAGVGKTDEELLQAVDSGIGLINIESAGEFERLRRLLERTGRTADVAFRITPGVVGGTHAYTETGTAATKFGIPVEEALELAVNAGPASRLRVTGLHAHFGSQIVSVEPFVEAFGQIRQAVERFRGAGIPISRVNCGGGLGIRYNEEAPPEPGELARAVMPLLHDLEVEVLIEPGRFLVGPAGILLSRVIDVKRTGARTFVVVDAAMNDLIRPALYGAHHEVLPVRDRGGRRRRPDLRERRFPGPGPPPPGARAGRSPGLPRRRRLRLHDVVQLQQPAAGGRGACRGRHVAGGAETGDRGRSPARGDDLGSRNRIQIASKISSMTIIIHDMRGLLIKLAC